jgi:hypothetical protein
MTKATAVIFFLFFLVNICNSQQKKYKWGKVDVSEFSEKDTTGKGVPAIILFDLGNQDYEVVHDDLLQYFTRHVRIKILNKAGYDFANVKILYENKNDNENVVDIDARSYWLNEKGEIESAKLDNSLIFDENINDRLHYKKFTIPSVREGCIIEYKYTITSNYIFYLNGWCFQNSVPTKYSALTNNIPEYFTFQSRKKGERIIEEGDEENSQKTFHFRRTSTAGENLQGYQRSYEGNLEMKMFQIKFSESDIPALEPEPCISSVKNYASSINFYLTGIRLPEGLRRDYSVSWKYLSEKLSEDENFGKAFMTDNLISDKARMLTKGIINDVDKQDIIYKYVTTSIAWNGIYDFYADKRLKKVLEDQKGTSAEINLILLQMLLASGIKAYPFLSVPEVMDTCNGHTLTYISLIM